MAWSACCRSVAHCEFPVPNTALALFLMLQTAHALTLAEVVDAAITRAPDAAPILADRATQQMRRPAPARLLPGAPYLEMEAAADRLTCRRGFNAFTAELGTPLWQPGEGRAAGRQAGAGILDAEARLAELRLAAVGLVRGAVSLVDDATLALPPPPRPVPDHPRLMAAQRAVEAARASLDLTRHSLRDSPVLALQGGQEQFLLGPGYDSRLGVVSRWPLATDSCNPPRIALAEAEAEWLRAHGLAMQHSATVQLNQALGAMP